MFFLSTCLSCLLSLSLLNCKRDNKTINGKTTTRVGCWESLKVVGDIPPMMHEDRLEREMKLEFKAKQNALARI
jgi:hypothetical protein